MNNVVQTPTIKDRGYLVDSILLSLITEASKKYAQAGTLLDVGCGDKTYAGLFKNSWYIGIDIRKNASADVICDARHLPFKEGCFRLCLSFQMLEHVDEPATVVKEIFRVLDFNGLLFVSLPASWPIHGAPHDYWRWTQYGLKKLLSDFTILELDRCRRSVASLIQISEMFVPRKIIGLHILFNIVGTFLDKSAWLDRQFNQFDINYFAIAKKAQK